MKTHFNHINSIHYRGVHYKNQITEERYESKGSRTVLKGRWEIAISLVDPTKYMVNWLSELAPVKLHLGWQKDGNGTSQIRKWLGLEKDKENKANQTPATHAVDGIALASLEFIQWKQWHSKLGKHGDWVGDVGITSAPFSVIRRPPISRRQLHLCVPGKGGKRRKYGGTVTRHGFRKGDLVKATKAKKTYIGWCSGDTKKAVSVSDINWKRLGQFTASKVVLLQRSTGLICKQENSFARVTFIR